LFFRYSSSSSVLLVLDLVHVLVLYVLIVYVLVRNCSSSSLSSSSSLFLIIILDTLDMILFLIYIISLIIMRLVCFDYIFGIDSLSLCLYTCLQSTHLIESWVGGQHCVSVVLIHCLPANALYTPGHVVDRGCDIPVESFVVHSPSVELSRTRSHYLVVTLFLSFVMEMFLVYGYEIT
jgi:hypothetical protein